MYLVGSNFAQTHTLCAVQWYLILLNVLQMNKQFISEIILRTICDQRFLLSVVGCLMGAVTFGTNDRGWWGGSGNRPGEHISLTVHLPSLTEPNLHILHCPQTTFQRVFITFSASAQEAIQLSGWKKFVKNPGFNSDFWPWFRKCKWNRNQWASFHGKLQTETSGFSK